MNMTLKELALFLGYSKDYFYTLRANDRDRYDFMFSFDANYYKSVMSCVDYITKLSKQMESILDEYRQSKKTYGIKLQNENLTKCKSPYGVYQTYDIGVYQIRDQDKDFLAIPLPVIKKWEKVIELLGNKD